MSRHAKDNTAAARPRRVRRWLILAIAAIPIIWIGVEIRWAYTAEPHPLDWRDDIFALHARYAPENPNAWPLFIEIMELFNQIEAEVVAEVPRIEGSEMNEWAPDYVDFQALSSPDIAHRELERERVALARMNASRIPSLIDQAIARGHAIPEAYPDLPLRDIGWSLTDDPAFRFLPVLRHYLRDMMNETMEQQIQNGDGGAAIATLRRGLGLSEVVSWEPVEARYLMAAATQYMMLRRCLEAVATGTLPTEMLETMIEALPTTIGLAPLNMHVEGWQLRTLDSMHRIFAGPGWGRGRYINTAEAALRMQRDEALRDAAAGFAAVSPSGPSELPAKWTNLLWWRWPDLSEVEAAVADVFDEMRQLADLPRHELNDSVWQVQIEHAQIAHLFDATHWRRELQAGAFVRDHAAMELEALRLLLHIERYRARHGHLPVSLEAMRDAGDLATPIVDPISGRSFGYRLIDAEQQSYQLYSFGARGEDNGGASSAEFDRNTLRVLFEADLAREYDYIIWASLQ